MISLLRRTTLFLVITQRVVAIFYRRFGKTYLLHPQGSRILLLDSWTLRMGTIGRPKTSLRNYHYSLRNSSEECGSQLLRGGNLKSRKFITLFHNNLTFIFCYTNIKIHLLPSHHVLSLSCLWKTQKTYIFNLRPEMCIFSRVNVCTGRE